MAKLVRFRVLDGIAVITMDAPPVNALSAELRGALWDVLGRAGSGADINAIVLIAEGRLFSAGADIREFGEPPEPPRLGALCSRIEDLQKPVVVGVQGQALGGGAEIALAAHYRLAAPNARIGLPEVALGLVPGAGGTQRLPRLIGAEKALQLILSTQSIDSRSAQRIGLVDGVVDGDMASGAVAFAQALVAEGKGPRRARDARAHLNDGAAFQAEVAKARKALSSNPLHAPQRVIDCVEASSLLPFDAALALEEDAFARCLAHPQSTALRHIFIAERKIDPALIERDGAGFKPIEPMGKSAVQRLRLTLRAAAEVLVNAGDTFEAEIDGALVDYGFRKGPFGGRDADPNREVLERLLAALMVEGAKMVEEQAVQRASDVDALAVHGLGFPRRHGGPMRAAQTLGLLPLRAKMRGWAEDSALWAVPELLDDAVKTASGFDAF